MPSGKELEKSALTAIKNIDVQLSKMPKAKKTPKVTDNFPWIYNDMTQFKPHIIGNNNRFETFI